VPHNWWRHCTNLLLKYYKWRTALWRSCISGVAYIVFGLIFMLTYLDAWMVVQVFDVNNRRLRKFPVVYRQTLRLATKSVYFLKCMCSVISTSWLDKIRNRKETGRFSQRRLVKPCALLSSCFMALTTRSEIPVTDHLWNSP